MAHPLTWNISSAMDQRSMRKRSRGWQGTNATCTDTLHHLYESSVNYYTYVRNLYYTMLWSGLGELVVSIIYNAWAGHRRITYVRTYLLFQISNILWAGMAQANYSK